MTTLNTTTSSQMTMSSLSDQISDIQRKFSRENFTSVSKILIHPSTMNALLLEVGNDTVWSNRLEDDIGGGPTFCFRGIQATVNDRCPEGEVFFSFADGTSCMQEIFLSPAVPGTKIVHINTEAEKARSKKVSKAIFEALMEDWEDDDQ